MNLKEARALQQGDVIADYANNIYNFIALDHNKDLIVECRSAVKGWIVLLRTHCQTGAKGNV